MTEISTGSGTPDLLLETGVFCDATFLSAKRVNQG